MRYHWQPAPGSTAVMITLAVSLLTGGTAVAFEPPPSEAYFAEPVTGRRVTGYSIELPLSDDRRQRFAVPGDCGELVRLIDQQLSYKGSIIDRRMWRKVDEDCWFHAFLHRHPTRDIIDFVSHYDFMNADLDDLPIDHACANPDDPGACRPGLTNARGVLRHFPLGESANGAQTSEQGSDTTAECMLRDGLFFGRMLVEADGIRCNPSTEPPSLRLIAVDYADIDGDGYLDAVLRFVPIGRGAARAPLILPLTRHAVDAPFEVVEPGTRPPLP